MRGRRISNNKCSIARAAGQIGDRWSILILREAYYGVKRFDQFQHYIGIAPNILSDRLKKLADAGILQKTPLPERAGRYEYVLTRKGLAFFPAYLALKKWGDDWLAGPEGGQPIFIERATTREVRYPDLLSSSGLKLGVHDVEVVIPGSGAVGFSRKRFLKGRSKRPVLAVKRAHRKARRTRRQR